MRVKKKKKSGSQTNQRCIICLQDTKWFVHYQVRSGVLVEKWLKWPKGE